ncbi:site-specific integrase [Sphingobium sp. PNB]|uniref:site-specific integrase n=1 Tax=Sphingobium sp. PNB TaxID=863934 RepID=UPI001CA44655|nr:site-specific integrase [Sphingobium sp. PNB]MCB4863112.1 site-specific integrase [Sphingobium sp. PNB]
MNRAVAMLNGEVCADDVPAERSPVFMYKAAEPSPNALTGVPVRLLDTLDEYIQEQRIKPSTASEWRSIMKKLIAFIGHDDASRLTVEQLDSWRDMLLTENTKRGTIRDPGTVKDKYLAAVRATLNWAVEKRRLSENVSTKITVRVPKKALLRTRDFNPDEVKAILSATLSGPWSGIDELKALARRWIPWICAYTGARVNEISQIRYDDIFKLDDVWVLRITPEAGTVKSNSTRVIPIHGHLIEQGIIDALKTGNKEIFYDPTRRRTGGSNVRYSKKVGESLRDWIRSEIGIIDPNVQPNHGWRHTFKTLALEVGIPERVADFIQGHAPRTVGQSYGSVSLPVLVAAISKIPSYEFG